jgi:hypothetical protein
MVILKYIRLRLITLSVVLEISGLDHQTNKTVLKFFKTICNVCDRTTKMCNACVRKQCPCHKIRESFPFTNKSRLRVLSLVVSYSFEN